MRFKDLVAASSDSFVNLRDLLVILDPINKININNRRLLPINRAAWAGGDDICLFAHLLPLTLSHLSSIKGEAPI